MLCEPKQVQTAVSPNFLTAQEARIFSNAELSNIWNRVLFTEHSDSKLKFLGKATSYDFLAVFEQQPTDFNSPPCRNRSNLYNVLGIGRHDHFSNIVSLFAPDQFGDALMALFGFPWFFLT